MRRKPPSRVCRDSKHTEKKSLILALKKYKNYLKNLEFDQKI